QHVALSYAWRIYESRAPSSLADKYEKQLPETIPNVIEDVTSVVFELDIRYIWVDQYPGRVRSTSTTRSESRIRCIETRSVLLLSQQALILRMVFLESEGDHKPASQPQARILGEILVSTLPATVELVPNFKWVTRAHVYQEAIFSRRCILFTD
ncbi:hypothetical protein K432DRAFT_456793, partial [Lepidopterella palustris CBS 459.81]